MLTCGANCTLIQKKPFYVATQRERERSGSGSGSGRGVEREERGEAVSRFLVFRSAPAAPDQLRRAWLLLARGCLPCRFRGRRNAW